MGAAFAAAASRNAVVNSVALVVRGWEFLFIGPAFAATHDGGRHALHGGARGTKRSLKMLQTSAGANTLPVVICSSIALGSTPTAASIVLPKDPKSSFAPTSPFAEARPVLESRDNAP